MANEDDNKLINRTVQKLKDEHKYTQARFMAQKDDILQNEPEEISFLHSVLCQVGMPRVKPKERVFERRSGGASLLLEAGHTWDARTSQWIEQPLPYGTKPRLILVYLSSQAIKTKSRVIDIGGSARAFLNELQISIGGGKNGGYTGFTNQINALAACRMVIGLSIAHSSNTIDAKPISKFRAWVSDSGDPNQQSLLPGAIELTHDFYESLVNHSVPLDKRALTALQNTALGLDIYTWLANRLCRINQTDGIKLSWANLREQFGHEYKDKRNFKREFLAKLHQVRKVYPDARIEEKVGGGIILKPSPPPIPKSLITVPNMDHISRLGSGGET